MTATLSPSASVLPEDPGHQAFESLGVHCVKRGRLGRVHVEDGDQAARSVQHRDHDFAGRAAVAGDVAKKGVDVVDDPGAPVSRRRATDAAAEGDSETTQRSLVRPDDQFVGLVGIDHIEAGPEEMGKGVGQHGGHCRHPCRKVRLAVQNSEDFFLYSGIAINLVRWAVVAGDIGHSDLSRWTGTAYREPSPIRRGRVFPLSGEFQLADSREQLTMSHKKASVWQRFGLKSR